MPAVAFNHDRGPKRAQGYPKVARQPSRRDRLAKISGIDLLETNKRIISLIQASNDGRKRATTLPPLPVEREPTFSRQPRTMQSLQCPPEEAAESHWQRKYVKVSMDVDKRIVTHLKKQMNKRLQQRLDEISNEDGSRSYTPGRDGFSPDKDRLSRMSKSNENGLFYKYTDYGEKVTGATRRHSLPVKSNKESPTPNKMNNGHSRSMNGTPDPVRNHKENSDISKSGITEVNETQPSEDNDVKLNDIPTNDEGDEEELKELTDLHTLDVATPDLQEIESFRKLNVSPVQTPSIVRPVTREETRNTVVDRVAAVLRGQVHKYSPPEQRVLELYVCSGFYDTLPERTGLMEKVYANLKDFCLGHGYDLDIYDLHWGVGDLISDDHCLPESCVRLLNKCQESTPCFNTMVILGDKFGPYIVPSIIPVEEFQAIYDHSKDIWTEEMKLIHSQLREIEQARTEREKQRNEAELNDENDPKNKKKKETRESQIESLKAVRKNADAIKLETQQIKSLQEQEKALTDPEILTEWYILDENSVPPVYRLQSISSQFKDYSKGDARKRNAAKEAFMNSWVKLRKIFDEFAEFAITDPTAKKRYFTTILGMELEHGVLETDAQDNHCIAIHRNITDLKRHLHDSEANKFTDVAAAGGNRQDPKLSSLIRDLKEDVIPEKINAMNILQYDIEWAPGGVTVGGHRAHVHYVDRLCKQTLELLKRQMMRNFTEIHKGSDRMELYAEVAYHVHMCHQNSSKFQGMRELLQLVKSYVRSDYPAPLVVHGTAGCGKTSLLCKAAKDVHKWTKGNQSAHVLLRIIGVTTESTNIRSLLRSLCLQLAEISSSSYEEVPTDFTGLVNNFMERITHLSIASKVVIILDSLDKLKDIYDGRKLNWLPKNLPKNVRIIISTRTEEKYECLPVMKKCVGEHTDVFLEMPKLANTEAVEILGHWLNKHERTLTEDQFHLILDAFDKCSYPLYLKLAFYESLSWTSHTGKDQLKLAENIKQFALNKFGQLEIKYGDALTRRALGYIAASRHGVTNNEMLDLLSLDDAVMDEIMLLQRLPRRRFPTLYWLRLREELSPFIIEIKDNFTKAWQWSHTAFQEAATERYLNSRDKAPSYHKALAEYFMGKWVDKPKPFTGNDKGLNRFVSTQRLYYEPDKSHKDGSDRVHNLRRINELPFHLLHSQQMDLYKSQALCNFEWVLAKLCGTSFRDLLEEYQIGLLADPNDTDLKTLSDTIQLSVKALTKDPRQLAPQMMGRLHGMLARDIPATAGDPPRYPCLHAFYEQAKSPSILSLLPSISCLAEPGGILFDLLSGHSEPITAITLTTDGTKAITASKDNTIKLWNLKTGRVMKTIEGTGRNVRVLISGFGNNFAITVEGSVIRIWNIRYSDCVLTIDHYLDPPVIGTAAEGKYLVAIFDGINTMRSWNLGKQIMPMVCEAKIEDHSVYKDNSVLIAPTSFDDKVLHAFRGANMATVQSAKSGKVVHVLKCNDKTSAVVALGVTRDYNVLACRQQYMHLHEIHQLELFDLKKGKYLRSVRGCTHDHITQMHINFMGSHAVCVCASEKTSTSDVAIWNLETEDHKHLAKHAGVSSMNALIDFRYCLTAAEGDRTLRIWNLSGRINQSQPKYKKSQGVSQIVPMIDNQRYVVARQINNGPISVWNVAKAKCLQSAVRIERGLSESADVVIIRNARVVILSDRGFSSAAETSRPVFQTVLVYDLQTKKFIRKLTGCYITPCPANEYVLLDDEHLLSLSDNRNHFVIWNLVNGQIDRRIKPSKELFATQPPLQFNEPLYIRTSTANMTPWERRAETDEERMRRHEEEEAVERKRQEELLKEKENGIEQYILSGDQTIAIASYFAHHMCVFDIQNERHLHTIEAPNSMLHLHVSALSADGRFLVLPNYDEESKTSYVTLWDCREGTVKKRLKNESNVMAIGIVDDASRVIIGKAQNELHIWDPMAKDGLKKIKGYKGLEFNFTSEIYVVDSGRKAVVFAGDISVWDVERASVLAIFTPDMRINCCNVAMNGQLITFGLHDISDLVVLKLGSKDVPPIQDLGEDIFGEVTESSDEDEDEDEDY